MSGESGAAAWPQSLPVQLSGSPIARALLRLFGWRVAFNGLPARQGVVIVYPHTSNWDFPVALLAKWSIGLQVTFWGKDTLFRWPLFGRWLRWLGGVPVDRHAANGIVGQMAGALASARERDAFLWLALSPEGTRELKPAWRSGFYHVALQGGVPLALVSLDYRERRIDVQHFMQLSGDIPIDMARIAAVFSHCTGRHPAQATPIRLEP
jgi:1-acyl-sn-glycerol-3-phosphate acyltransferase